MDLSRLFRPKTIATIGGREAAAAVRACRRMGFAGDVWPVHPTAGEVEGLPCYRSVEDLPAAPDASFIGVNRESTINLVKQLAARRAGGAVAYASGFKESDETGQHLQATLVEAAGATPVLGPNCYGLINYLDGALLWPDQHGGRRVERGVALIMQSSNIAINLTMNRRALPIAYVVCLGNQAVVGISDVMRAVADDSRVSAIGLYMEGLDDPNAFANAALDLGHEKPIVALRGGRSAAGAKQAVSHTASITGNGAVMSAFLKRLGISEVTSLPVLLETLKLLHIHSRLRGNSMISLSCSGGEAALMADGASRTGSAGSTCVSFPPFTEQVRDNIAKTTHPLVAVGNPFDYHTFDWGKPDRLKVTFEAVMTADVDLTALVFDWPREDRTDAGAWQAPLQAWCEAAKASSRPSAVIASLPETMPETLAEGLIAQGIAPLAGIPDALHAIDAAASIAATDIGTPPLAGSPGSIDGDAIVSLDEQVAKALLRNYGLNLPTAEIATSTGAAVNAADRIGYPIVLKALGIEHKTDRAALRLNLDDPDAVTRAATDLLTLSNHLLVETMVEGGVAELIIGASIDPVIGLHLVIGSGGVLVDLIGDSEVLILPCSDQEVREALSCLKVSRLLQGYRGHPAGDIDAVVAAILDIQRFVLDHRGSLAEMDINPLIVRPEGQGTIAVDALIRMVGEQAATSAKPPNATT